MRSPVNTSTPWFSPLLGGTARTLSQVPWSFFMSSLVESGLGNGAGAKASDRTAASRIAYLHMAAASSSGQSPVESTRRTCREERKNGSGSGSLPGDDPSLQCPRRCNSAQQRGYHERGREDLS